VGKIILDNFSVEKAIRSLKFGVYFFTILCILDAIEEQQKLVYGKLNVTCCILGFFASLIRTALFGFGSNFLFFLFLNFFCDNFSWV